MPLILVTLSFLIRERPKSDILQILSRPSPLELTRRLELLRSRWMIIGRRECRYLTPFAMSFPNPTTCTPPHTAPQRRGRRQRGWR
eukprot:3718382-Rhodomonas_salina.1